MGHSTVGQFWRFSIAGGAGFLVDASVLVFLQHSFSLGPIPAQLGAFLCANVITWSINRHWAFSGHSGGNLALEWLRYLLSGGASAVVINGVFAGLIVVYPFFAHHPVTALAASSLCGAVVSFVAAKYWVFHPRWLRNTPIPEQEN